MNRVEDTSSEAKQRQLEAWRRAGGSGRLRLAFELSTFVRSLALRRIRMKDAELSEEEASAVLIRDLYSFDVPVRSRDA